MEDTTVGAVLFMILAAGLLGAVAAFVLAIAAAVKHERWALL